MIVDTLSSLNLRYAAHHDLSQYWTSPLIGGVIDAQFIAIIDIAIELLLGQIAMIPMLAWIARNAPDHLKATFFAVMASFTNLALSASSLATKHLNQIYIVPRELHDPRLSQIAVAADYSELGRLLIIAALILVGGPLITVFIIQRSRLRTRQ